MIQNTHKKYNQQGFLLPAAIFILVILAAIGAYALNVSSIQQATSTQDLQGSRAYQAARAGLEWATYQVLSPGSTTLVNCPTSPSVLGLNGFSVAISCTRYPDYYEQGTDHTIAIYDIVATASFGNPGLPNYIERQLQITLSKCLGTDATPSYQCS